MSDIKSALPTADSSDGVDGAAAPSLAIQIAGKDGSGNLQAILTDTVGNQAVLLKDSSANGLLSVNSQLETRDIISVSSQYAALSVTTTSVLAKGGASALTNRKVISILPTNGVIYWGTSSAVTTTTGSPIFKNQNLVLSFTDAITIYLISAGTVDVRIVEGS